jgi:hypothetical protein
MGGHPPYGARPRLVSAKTTETVIERNDLDPCLFFRKTILSLTTHPSREGQMHQAESQDPLIRRIRFLESRIALLTRMFIALTLVALIAGLSAFVSNAVTQPVSAPSKDSVIVVRALSVVDSRGVERVRIAAPLPDPIMLGRRFERGEAVSGIILYDSEGNERGGYITDESRNAALTLDEINRAAVHIGTNDRGEAHISLSNGRGGYAIMGMRPSGTFLSLDGKRVALSADSSASSK